MAKTYTLYTYFRSSCAGRVRIGAHLKGIKLEYKFIHLVKRDQNSEAYAALNPSQAVPTLVIAEEGVEELTIRQSVAILEYFDEVFPNPPLLPPTSDPAARAKVRELVNVVACDIQPVTNTKIHDQIKPAGMDVGEWQKHFMTKGLRAYEKLASVYPGKYSFGDTITIADVVLAPAIDNAFRFGVDVSQFPKISGIAKEFELVDAFRKGRWMAQPDTPEEFKQK